MVRGGSFCFYAKLAGDLVVIIDGVVFARLVVFFIDKGIQSVLDVDRDRQMGGQEDWPRTGSPDIGDQVSEHIQFGLRIRVTAKKNYVIQQVI